MVTHKLCSELNASFQKTEYELSTEHDNIKIYAFNNSFNSLSYDRSKTSSKASSPHSAMYSFLLQMTVSTPIIKFIR
jgi:hypothetical protein